VSQFNFYTIITQKIWKIWKNVSGKSYTFICRITNHIMYKNHNITFKKMAIV